MKKPIAPLAAALFLAGCSFGLVYHVDQPAERLVFAPGRATAQVLGVDATASYLGPGERIATSRTLLGNITREVDPYGEDQILFAVTVRNSSDSVAVVEPKAARLVVLHQVEAARTLDDYKKAWPTYPIESENMATDQAEAFAYVLRTLLLEQQIVQGDSAAGRLAFPAPGGAEGTASIDLPVTVGGESGTLRFAFRVEPPPRAPARAQ